VWHKCHTFDRRLRLSAIQSTLNDPNTRWSSAHDGQPGTALSEPSWAIYPVRAANRSFTRDVIRILLSTTTIRLYFHFHPHWAPAAAQRHLTSSLEVTRLRRRRPLDFKVPATPMRHLAFQGGAEPQVVSVVMYLRLCLPPSIRSIVLMVPSSRSRLRSFLIRNRSTLLSGSSPKWTPRGLPTQSLDWASSRRKELAVTRSRTHCRSAGVIGTSRLGGSQDDSTPTSSPGMSFSASPLGRVTLSNRYHLLDPRRVMLVLPLVTRK